MSMIPTLEALKSDRATLARTITVIESTRPDHQQHAQDILSQMLPQTGKSVRIGITGVPGVGKSTFIEAFGLYAIERGHKVAVLAVDPSSTVSGGSIMGDKTRMMRLSQHPKAYIRPSPTAGSLGGVARRTREAMLLCEAAGYDIIIVETVGVGQSETQVASMTDIFMLLLLPGSGDELQGIKKGIVELADVLVVNKADGELAAQAKRVKADYTAAVRILTAASPHWQPKVLTCSALENNGIGQVWDTVQEFIHVMQANGEIEARRAKQSVQWMWKEIEQTLMEDFLNRPDMTQTIADMEQKVQSQQLPPLLAAKKLLSLE